MYPGHNQGQFPVSIKRIVSKQDSTFRFEGKSSVQLPTAPTAYEQLGGQLPAAEEPPQPATASAPPASQPTEGEKGQWGQQAATEGKPGAER